MTWRTVLAERANARALSRRKRGGRPVKLQRAGNVEGHAEAELMCVTATDPAFRAGSLAARQ